MIQKCFKMRKDRGATCPECYSPDYEIWWCLEGKSLTPEFKCNICGNTWECGLDGGKYLDLNTEDKFKGQRYTL